MRSILTGMLHAPFCIGRRAALVVMSALSTLSVPAAGAADRDLLSAGPAGADQVVPLDPAAIAVEGSARTTVRGDTLDVVLSGGDARIVFDLRDLDPASIDGIRLTIGASGAIWAEPRWQHAGTSLAREEAQPLPHGRPATTDLPLPQVLTRHGIEDGDAAVLVLPRFVGRVQIVGGAAWLRSPAPRANARWPERLVRGRVLHAGTPARWDVRLPPRPQLVVELTSFGNGADRTHDRLVYEILAEGEVLRTGRVEVPHAASGGADPASRTLRLDLEHYGGMQVALILRVDATSARDLIFLAGPRIVDLDAARPPVLLIVVDTLRKFDPGLSTAPTRPRMHAFAETGIDFTDARANSSWTLPSTASLLSGRLPSHHGLDPFGPGDPGPIDPGTPLLAAELHAAGWATAAVSANPLVSPGTGLERGFDHFDGRPARDPQLPSAEHAVEAALRWIRPRTGTSWMLYLHLFDPHDPYQAPPPWRERSVDPGRRPGQHPSGIWSGQPNLLRDALAAEDSDVPVRARDVDLLAELYRGEVAYVDHQIGALVDSLRAWGEFERAVIVVTSDHGEEFLEHGMLKHGHALHEELIGVPLTMRLPGTRPHTIGDAVSLVDLAPTLRGWLGLPTQNSEGRDLTARIRGESSSIAPALTVSELNSRLAGAWNGRWRSVVDFPWKWVQTPRGERLYRLDLDPAERHDLHPRSAAVSARLRAHADSITATSKPPVTNAEEDPARRAILRSLGYID